MKEAQEKLEGLGQGHLFEAWPEKTSNKDKERFFKQVQQCGTLPTVSINAPP